jgi:arylsulfatase A-like enzyme
VRGNRAVVGVALAAALVLGLLAVGAARGGRQAPPARATGPNVLVIVTDDARVGTMVAMPKTERWMAAGGVTYRQGYDTTPSCCPSRSSIFTGRYVHNHGVLTQAMGDRLDQATTLQHDLKEHGYLTAMAGKFLNRWPLRRPPPWFDRYALANGGYYDQTWAVDGAVRKVPTYSTTFIGDKAIQYLADFRRADGPRPWFLYLATFAPHDPRIPEPRYAHAGFPPWHGLAVNEPDVGDKPGYLRRRAPVPAGTIGRVRTQQLRTLRSVDDMVDRVMRALQAGGELDDTLVFFLSDNGYAWGEHRWVGKFLPYTESIQVPFYARWPGRLPAGTSSDRMVANIDLKPTVLAAAGIPSGATDGRSLLGPGGGHDTLLFEYWHDLANAPGVQTWAALRAPGWEYVEDEDQPGVPGRLLREYYDLRKDPGMERNLLGDGDPAGDPPVGELSARLAAARRCAGETCP